jgi:CRP-like cAMP-binding protein
VEPAWLLRVGLYLELLTCLAIVEVVRDEVGDLLSPEERAAFDGDTFAPIRERLDVDAWREPWQLREIALPHRGLLRAGPVSLLNLMQKKRATLAFLHAHHEDLKRAIELAGANPSNAQETWQRVFRDAERAVLRQTPHAFPELGYLPGAARHLVLWHRQGRFDVVPALRVPRAVAGLFADQDGLFPAACNQYRDSMNAVAAWAREQSLMDVAGRDCIPREVSLLEAYMHAKERVPALQRRDGYGDRLDVTEVADASEPPVEDAEELLARADVFRMLSPAELRTLAASARPLALGPTERFVVEGTEGSSLFVVADGEVEIMCRGGDGRDRRVGTLGRGDVVGEMSLLTGERRSATARAVDAALVYEIGRRQYEPLLRAHRDWVDELVQIMDGRLAADGRSRRPRDLGRLVRRHFFERGDARSAGDAAGPAA